jgi:hypothetical protein
MEHMESCPSISSLGYFLEYGKPLDWRHLALLSKAQKDDTLWGVYAPHARSAAQRISRAAFAKVLETGSAVSLKFTHVRDRGLVLRLE